MKKNLLAVMFMLVFISGVSVMSICSAVGRVVTAVDSDSDGEGDKGNGDLPKQDEDIQDIDDVVPFTTETKVLRCFVKLVSSDSDEEKSGLAEGSKSIEEKVNSCDGTSDDVSKKKCKRKRSIENTAETEQNDDDIATQYNVNETSGPKQMNSGEKESGLVSEGSNDEAVAKSPDGIGDGTPEKDSGYVSISEVEPAPESELGSESELDQISKSMRLKQKDDTSVRDVSFWEKFKNIVFSISDDDKKYIRMNGFCKYLMTNQKSFYDEIRSYHINKVDQSRVLDIITCQSLSEKFKQLTPERGRYLDRYPPSEFLQVYYGPFYEEYVRSICDICGVAFRYEIDKVINKIFGTSVLIARQYAEQLDKKVWTKHLDFKKNS